MAQRKLPFICWHPDCADEPPLEVVVNDPQHGSAARGSKEIARYCERGHLNMIPLQETWENHPLVLGDPGVIVDRNGQLVVQGRKP